MNTSGSVLVEAAAALLVSLLGAVFFIEVARRVWIQVALQHSAFRYVRLRALGVPSHRAKRQLKGLLSPSAEIEERAIANGLSVRVHLRYPSLISFPIDGEIKHHFEVTKTCSFPFSR